MAVSGCLDTELVCKLCVFTSNIQTVSLGPQADTRLGTIANGYAETSTFEVNHLDYLLMRQITFVTAGSFLCLSS